MPFMEDWSGHDVIKFMFEKLLKKQRRMIFPSINCNSNFLSEFLIEFLFEQSKSKRFFKRPKNYHFHKIWNQLGNFFI